MIILASQSPRRRELLEQIGADFRVVTQPCEELAPDSGEMPERLTEINASTKSETVARHLAAPGQWVLGADTVVALAGRIYGKPQDADDAVRMLHELSGRTHDVTTGICLTRRTDDVHYDSYLTSVTTHVTMRELSDEEIASYVATGEPLDKAGAYGIQGRAAVFITSIEGSYSNVVGLPLAQVAELARQVGAELWP